MLKAEVACESRMAGRRLGNSRKSPGHLHYPRRTSQGLPARLPDNSPPKPVSWHFSSKSPSLVHVTVRHRAAWDRTHAPNLRILPEQCWEKSTESIAAPISVSLKENSRSDSNDPASRQIKAAQTSRRCLQTAMTTLSHPQLS